MCGVFQRRLVGVRIIRHQILLLMEAIDRRSFMRTTTMHMKIDVTQNGK